jgi:uncharacterized protein (DUF2062 family)
MMSGLVVLAVGCGLIGYLVSGLLWRMWITNKWRRRRLRNADPL